MTHAGGRPSRVKDCEFWLTAYLSGGKRPFADVLRAGGMQNPPFAERTLRKTKKELDFISIRKGFGPTAVYYWRDPSVPEAEPANDPSIGNAAILSAIHELKEERRISLPPVRSSSSSSSPPKSLVPASWGAGVAINPNDPNDPMILKFKAREEARKRAEVRAEELRGVIDNADPIALLHSCNSDEIDEMKGVVQRHLVNLENRSRGEPKFKRGRQVTERTVRQVPEIDFINGEWVPTSKMTDVVEEKITFVPDPNGNFQSPDGYEGGEDVSAELTRWNTWMVEARNYAKQLSQRSKIVF